MIDKTPGGDYEGSIPGSLSKETDLLGNPLIIFILLTEKRKPKTENGIISRRAWFIRIMGGILVWTLLIAGFHPAAAQVQDGNPSRGGETLEIKPFLSRDRTTVIDFYSPYCYPCVQMLPYLEKLASRLPEAVFVRVNINRPEVKGIDWKSPLARQYRLKSVPYYMIFSPQGKLVAEGVAARNMIKEWLQKTGVEPQAGK